MMKRLVFLLLLGLGGCQVHFHVMGKYYVDSPEPEPAVTVEIGNAQENLDGD